MVEYSLHAFDKAVQRLAVSRSLPSNLLRQNISLNPTTICPSSANIDGKVRNISVTQQLNYINKTLTQPFKNNYLLLIGVDSVETRAQTLAALIMLQATKLCLEKPQLYPNAPLWYAVRGGYSDRLRDEKNYLNMAGKPGMLILTNIAVNSTPQKVESTRDLLTIYGELPRLVVISGQDPLVWAREFLYMYPSRVVYLGNRENALNVKQV